MKLNTKNLMALIAALSLAVTCVGCGAASSTASSTAASAPASSAVQEQAESAASSEDTDLDYSGRYMDGNDEDANVIELTRTEDGSYEVTIGLYRLCEMSGTGSAADGTVELVLTDPNDNEMTAVFYPEDEYTYAFKVTVSTWDYLPEGTEFTGFQSVDDL